MSIVRNSAWNVIGIVFSTLFTIPSLAIYSRLLGVELLGLLTLTFSIVGYASSFDFGLSRALIRQVSVNIDNKERVKAYMGTTSIFVGIISLVVGGILWACSDALTAYLKVTSVHRHDAIMGFQLLSLSIPPYLLSLVGSAYFEGKEDFKVVNIIRSATGGLNAIIGVSCVFWIPTLSTAVAALCASRWLMCVIVLHLYRIDINRADFVRRPAILTFDRSALRSSLAYGGWMTVTNVIGPVMGYFDRFVLSHFAGATVVAFYTVPSEVINRLLLIPGAVSKALFPRLSKRQKSAASDRKTGLILTLACSALTALPMFIFAREILSIWMGTAYGSEPADVLRILLVGFFFTSLSYGPFTDLQARGYSRKTAYIHLSQVVPYIGMLIILTRQHGLIGTAIAWTARNLVDYFMMEFYSRRFVGINV